MKRTIILISVVLALGFLFTNRAIKKELYHLILDSLLSHSVHTISVQKSQGESNAIFIDAREKGEFEVSKIRGSKWVGYSDFDLARFDSLPKNSPLIVYCSVGYRSEKVAEKLRSVGFDNVSNLYGGIFEWVNEGYDIVDSSSMVTNKIHGYDRLWSIWLDAEVEKVYE
ncbi:MAG: rhodanese-like domain-containing protein [Cyclobacteriaceae bacterium]